MRKISERNSEAFAPSDWGSLPGPLLEKIFFLAPDEIIASRTVNKNWHRSSYGAVKSLQPDELSEDIRDFKNTENLNLSEVKVQPCNQTLEYLKNLPNLKQINLFGCWKLTESGLQHLQTLVRLKSLSLSSCFQLVDHDVACLSLLSSLEDLNLSKCSALGDRSLEHLSNLRKIQKLDLSNCENIAFLAPAMNNLQALSKISSLNLSHNQKINDQSVEALSRLTSLQILEMEDTRVGNSGLRHLSRLSKLQTLNVSQCFLVGDQGLDIRQIRHLQSLNLTYCSVKTEDLALIAEMEKMTSLQISGNDITNQGIQSLEKLAHLKDLTMRCPAANLNPIAFEALSGLTSLDIHSLSSKQRKRLITQLPNLLQLNEKKLSPRKLARYRTDFSQKQSRSTKYISDVANIIPDIASKSTDITNKEQIRDVAEDGDEEIINDCNKVPNTNPQRLLYRKCFEKAIFLNEKKRCAAVNLNPSAFEALLGLTSLDIHPLSTKRKKRLIIQLPNLIQLNEKKLSSRKFARYRKDFNQKQSRSTKYISDVANTTPDIASKSTDVSNKEQIRDVAEYGDEEIINDCDKKPNLNPQSFQHRKYLEKTIFLNEKKAQRSRGFWSSVRDFWMSLISWLTRFTGLTNS